MLEWVGMWDDALRPSGRIGTDFTSFISPGFRKAFNFASGAQLVVGAAAPFSLNDSAPTYGIFLYASFEHMLHK